jgi:hypothetical protein
LPCSINYLDSSISRFNPKLLGFVFIPADIVSLVLQAAGGATSSKNAGGEDSKASNAGLKVSQAGLAIQVITIVIFIIIGIDYLVRFGRSKSRSKTDSRFKIFLAFLSISILLILGRCIFRIDELKDGYRGELFSNEKLFYGFEST